MKKNFTLKLVSGIFMLVFSLSSYAQERTCGMLEYMEEMLKDPEVAKEYEKNQKLFKAEIARQISNNIPAKGGATIIMPVAVHFPTANEADRDCLEALAQNQVDILNADFTAANSDISQWTAASSSYPGVNTGAVNIQFCLARFNHPVGVDPELLEGEPAVTIGYNFANGSGFPEFDSNFQGYMNFLVKPIGDLGYSPKGGSIANGMAVVSNMTNFGSGAGCPGSGVVPQTNFDLGRTVTHELGHFYNLGHPWGDPNGGCGLDDAIADTPLIAGPSFGCPLAGSVPACNPGEFSLTMNFMDYVNDACMYMFSAGQVAVMDAYVSGVLQSQLNTNVCAEQLSVTEFETDQFSIYPNPNEGEFTVKLISSSNSDININVFDIRGRRIFTNSYTNNAYFNEVVRLNAVQSGMYLITVTDGDKTATKKIIIE